MPERSCVAPVRSSGVLDLVGNTPLVRLRAFERPGVELYAKAEWQNPGGSVKDRAALRIIADAERRGALDGGRTILDATSGNTGIAYAMMAAVRGYRLTLCVPENVTPERKRILAAFGAELIVTSAMEGSDGAIRMAQRLAAQRPDAYVYADQYNSDANWQAHFDTTGPEILAQTGGRLTHVVCGLGTSGTFMGVGRRLRRDAPGVRLISVEPDSPLHGIEGLKHMETAIRPGIYDASLADAAVQVSTERAIELTRRLARAEGLLVGVSSGAALAAALDLAATLARGVIVMIFPDSGSRYLSERFWDEPRCGSDRIDRNLIRRRGGTKARERSERARRNGPPSRPSARSAVALAEAEARPPGRASDAVRGSGGHKPPGSERMRERAIAASLVVIDEALLPRIRRHAAEAYPHECCGALIAVDGVVIEVVELPNTTRDGARRRFLVGPDDYRLAEARARAAGGTLAGFYHSHPDHPARPSGHDLEQAWPNLIYVIVAVQQGRPGEVTCWRLRDDRSAFEEGELLWRTGS